jgi:hypothetical protein
LGQRKFLTHIGFRRDRLQNKNRPGEENQGEKRQAKYLKPV